MIKLNDVHATMIFTIVKSWMNMMQQARNEVPLQEGELAENRPAFDFNEAQEFVNGELRLDLTIPESLRMAARRSDQGELEAGMDLLRKQLSGEAAPGGDDLLDLIEHAMAVNSGGMILAGRSLDKLYDAMFIGSSKELKESLGKISCVACGEGFASREVGVVVYTDNDRNFPIQFYCARCGQDYADSLKCSTKGCEHQVDIPDKLRHFFRVRKCHTCVQKEKEAREKAMKNDQPLAAELPPDELIPLDPNQVDIERLMRRAAERDRAGIARAAAAFPFRNAAWRVE